MNNKPKNIQPNTAAEGDNSINTKKGFLISLPSKKKGGAETESGIIMAKTINETPSNPAEAGRREQPQTHKEQQNGGKHGEKKRNESKSENGSARQNRDEKRQERRNASENSDAKREKTENRAGNAENGKEPRENSRRNGENRNKNENRNKKQGGKSGEKNQKTAEQTAEIKNAEAANAGQKNGAPKKNDGRNGRNGGRGSGAHEEKQGHKNSQNRQPGKNSGNDRRAQGRKQTAELPGLSPLSKDMQAYAKFGASDFAEISGESKKKELSLEEKYGGAVPLAEQIAAEEAKRRRKPKAMITEEIDRTLTANADIAESKDGEEAVLPNDGRDFEVVGIRFREAGKVYYFDPDGKNIPYGTPVIVETARGAEYGYTAISNRLVPYDSVIPPLKKIKRVATQADTEKYVANKSLEGDAAEIFKQKVAALGLKMNLVFVEYTFDNTKLLFYFTAETRIDFRELVKELASVFRTRIELRQIGVRDEAKMLGGLGVCGRSVCCNSFLGDFAQVSIKMAKDQGLSLNSAKISGACGKLMCCLRYEDKVYEEEMARTPKVGSIVETAEGRGVVTEAQALKGIVKVTLENAPEAPAKAFDREEVKVVGFNKAAVREDAEEMKKLKELEDNN